MSVTCVPPFRGELGIAIRYHVPAVRALPRPVVACIESGLEALYVDAEHIIVERREDAERKDTYSKDGSFVAHWHAELLDRYPGCRIAAPDRRRQWPERRFVPEPHVPQGTGPVDVVICPRYRTGGPDTPESKRRDIEVRNWSGWPGLAGRLADAGLRVFAAGRADTSVTALPAGETAWAHDRVLDATIEAMRQARLVVATDSGLAHLAVLCGRPLLMVTADGRPAPGYPWRVRYDEYYAAANHCGVRIDMVDEWDDVAMVADAVLVRLERERAA